ncbi:zinc finger MYND domain-containing protein 15 isoform X3 [Lates calcarifer]|uniref:Zinc finger MYND domain-containing protein 15 isoform X3 n=1 Tax=Lates calcarifer TaxID=8187 RepID=A0AAJ7Q8C1_LATCA|nr:zinc finger MYND domain-containing protein 15 isoform X3 [Lates calcarifer]
MNGEVSSLSSVVAPVLSSALSVYYIITSLVPKHFPDLNLLKKQTLRIHILESYREFHTMLTFWELSVLLPHVTFELVFIGGHLPGWGDKVLHHFFIQKINGSVSITDSSLIPDEEADKRIIRVTVHRCTYHTLQGPVPDLVVGFKPAFLRNDSWFSTLPKLQTLRVPAFFCEISELRCESSEEVMNKATGGTVSPPTINPFHCPLRINGGDNRLPRGIWKKAIPPPPPAAAAAHLLHPILLKLLGSKTSSSFHLATTFLSFGVKCRRHIFSGAEE